MSQEYISAEEFDALIQQGLISTEQAFESMCEQWELNGTDMLEKLRAPCPYMVEAYGEAL